MGCGAGDDRQSPKSCMKPWHSVCHDDVGALLVSCQRTNSTENGVVRHGRIVRCIEDSEFDIKVLRSTLVVPVIGSCVGSFNHDMMNGCMCMCCRLSFRRPSLACHVHGAVHRIFLAWVVDGQ